MYNVATIEVMTTGEKINGIQTKKHSKNLNYSECILYGNKITYGVLNSLAGNLLAGKQQQQQQNLCTWTVKDGVSVSK